VRPPPKPEDNIGPAYVILAVILMGAGLFFISVDIKSHGLGWPHIGGFVTVVMLFLAIARPKKFDLVVKNLADKVPGLKFTKDVNHGGE